jgi:hypothetical protein
LPQVAENCILQYGRQKPVKAKFADFYRITLFFFLMLFFRWVCKSTKKSRISWDFLQENILPVSQQDF